MKKVIGKVTLKDSSTYDVRTCTGGETEDNKSYVSSETGGKTSRVAGNLDATWEISLYAKDGESEIPAGLCAGQIINLQHVGGARVYEMIIDSAWIEAGGISLSCSACSAASYPD